MNLRLRAFFGGFFLSILSLLFQRFIGQEVSLLFWLGLVVFGMWVSWWVLSLDLKPFKLFIFSLYPMFALFLFSFWGLGSWLNFPGQEFSSLFHYIFRSLGQTIFYYSLFLSLNILNVSLVKSIPLKKAAHWMIILFCLILVSGWLFILENNLLGSLSILERVGESILIFFLLSFPVLWLAQDDNDRCYPFLESSIIALVLSEFFLIFSFYNGGILGKIIFLSGMLYTLLVFFIRLLLRDVWFLWKQFGFFVFLLVIFLFLYQAIYLFLGVV